ncbi:WAT1-related protein At5g47470-like [Rosa rugosa]|uniref:WAT1-related protein At5g47470-like n=1 Tax=Rosa rugosa TaxID=74645 RepID=UPI002B405AB8|nr:WAT1-related protein At5g47470-like [Rosa rugosa]
MAAAMPNLAPGSICVIACTVRLERAKLSCLYSKVKILGTLLCVVSAFTMSIMQSTTSAPATEIQYQAHSPDVIFDKQKIISCLYLLAAVFVLFSNVVLQVVEIVDRYEADCIPASSRSVKVIYIQTSGNKTCNRTLMESMVNIDLPMT